MSRWLNLALFIVVVLIGYGLTIYTNLAAPTPTQLVQQTKTIPDFSFTDLSGKTHNVSTFQDKIVILNFWASWCAPCVVEFPALLKIAADNPDIVLIALSSDRDIAAIEQFMTKQKNPTANVFIAHDREDITLKTFGISRLPETIIADKTLTQRNKLIGADWSVSDLQKIIDSLR